MNIFNIKWKNNKVIIINLVPSLKPTKTISNNGYCVSYHDEQIIGVNIFNSNLTDKYNLGSLFPDTHLLNEIKAITHIDLISCNYEPNIVIGRIVSANSIDGTHLQKCIVDINSNQLEIVCGADNARANLITVVALDNAIIPTGKLIKKGKLMGHTSNGMLCSWKELGLEVDAKGIIELDSKYENEIGNPFRLIYSNIN